MKNNLMKCPFCGNDNFNPKSLDPVIVVEDKESSRGLKGEEIKTYYVKCFRCTAQGGQGMTGYDGLTDTYTDEEKARQIAIDNWNMRRKPADNIRKL